MSNFNEQGALFWVAHEILLSATGPIGPLGIWTALVQKVLFLIPKLGVGVMTYLLHYKLDIGF